MTIKILLQTTIVSTPDDWSIARFELLAKFFRQQQDASGKPLLAVAARDRASLAAPDPVLSTLDRSDFDEMWLFAVDTGSGLRSEECAAIGEFRRRGGGLLVTRDHMDLGSSVCNLNGVGAAHHFHTKNLDPVFPLQRDDPYTTQIDWPNFHSGANGDFQQVEVVGAVHPVLVDPSSPTGALRFLPSHPHEGAVSAPERLDARVIARGKSKVTGRSFNLAVAFEGSSGEGRAIAESSFHHFTDYNWDPRRGCPTFVTEPAGDAMLREPEALASVHRYVLNVAIWLAGARKQ
ncbi:MAG: hypothetical protein JSR66_20395 [Proteobacteria bacterium]|nr:hypothetical protein [Pseudomonadota bacterium]